MNTHADKKQENKRQSVANAVSQKQRGSESTFQFVDNRPEAVAQRNLQELANNSPQAKQAAQSQAMADNYSTQQEKPIQKKENNTGLPDNVKSGIENLSGYSMDDVKVHYNSEKPAQLQAHAYAQGTDIHLGPSQEKHLAHEAWHVVQQKQGRVKPTMQLKENLSINDDILLEKEADVMGARALQLEAEFTPDNHKESKKVAVLQREKQGESQDQKALLELASDLEKHKSKIPGYSENQVEHAIQTIVEAVQSEPLSILTKSVQVIKQRLGEADEKKDSKTVKQFSYWGIAGAIGGGILGLVVPLIGTYLGYQEGAGGRHGSVAKGIGGAVLGTLPPVSAFLTGRELYRRGRVFDVINALNFAALPAAPGIFQLGNFQFGSNHGGVIGSMYFQGGGNNQRIRLCHNSGPTIGAPHALAGYQAYFPPYAIQYGTTWTNSRRASKITAWAAGPPGGGAAVAPVVPVPGNHIIEYSNLNAGRYGTRHPSRGVVDLLGGLTQNHINLIHHGVTSGFNSNQLRLYINTLINSGNMLPALAQ